MRLKNKWALVTGGSRGIGSGICFELAKEGCNVIVNYLSSPESAEKVVFEINAIGRASYSYKADVANRNEVNEMFAFPL